MTCLFLLGVVVNYSNAVEGKRRCCGSKAFWPLISKIPNIIWWIISLAILLWCILRQKYDVSLYPFPQSIQSTIWICSNMFRITGYIPTYLDYAECYFSYLVLCISMIFLTCFTDLIPLKSVFGYMDLPRLN